MIRLVLIVLFVVLSGGFARVQAASVCSQDSCVNVEIVTKFEDMKRGLQGRDGLAQGKGMLFIFDFDDRQKFWMKDMKFAIDMVWIDNQKNVVTVKASCPACVKDPCDIYEPTKDARYVLELPAEFALKHGFKEGMVLQFKDIS